MINQNDLAREITIMEGGNTNLSIAQVKEVLKATWIIIAEHLDNEDYQPSEVLHLIEKYK